MPDEADSFLRDFTGGRTRGRLFWYPHYLTSAGFVQPELNRLRASSPDVSTFLNWTTSQLHVFKNLLAKHFHSYLLFKFSLP